MRKESRDKTTDGKAGAAPAPDASGRARRPSLHHQGHPRRKTKVRHRRSTAHERARYRCFLPDLAGLAGKRRAEPMPDSTYYQEITENRNARRNFRLSSSQAMAESECPAYKKLKERENRAHAAWTSHLFRN